MINLSLHKILKSIVDCDGANALDDVLVVNKLSDLQAYGNLPSAKYVLRAIIDGGYAKKMQPLKKWDAQCITLQDKFITETGFQRDIVEYLFQSIMYAFGKKKEIELSSSNSNSPKPSNQTVAKPGPRASSHLWEEYIESLIEWVESPTDIKKEFGISLSLNTSVSSPKYGFNILLEARGKLKKYLGIHYCIYGKSNRILATDIIDFYDLDDFRSFTTAETNVSCNLTDVERVVIYVK